MLSYEKDFSTAELCIASSLSVKGVMFNTCSARCTHIDNIIATRHHSAERESESRGERKAKSREVESEEKRKSLCNSFTSQ